MKSYRYTCKQMCEKLIGKRWLVLLFSSLQFLFILKLTEKNLHLFISFIWSKVFFDHLHAKLEQ